MVRWCTVVCGECYNLELIDRSVVVVLSPTSLFVFENSKNTRNKLDRPVMGTIFLVILKIYNIIDSSYKWVSHNGPKQNCAGMNESCSLYALAIDH